MRYEYRGPVPVPDDAGELVHPLDVRELDMPPDCPPWEPLDEPQAEAAPPPPPPGGAAVTLPASRARTPKGK